MLERNSGQEVASPAPNPYGMNSRLAAPLVVLAIGALALPADAKPKPKPITQAYDVTAPVPYAVDGASHCADGVEGLSKNTRPVTLPAKGVLQIELSGYLGDWVLELFDAKGKMLGQAAAFDPANAAPKLKLTYKKAAKGQKVQIAVCNVTGGPTAKVKYTFTYA